MSAPRFLKLTAIDAPCYEGPGYEEYVVYVAAARIERIYPHERHTTVRLIGQREPLHVRESDTTILRGIGAEVR